MHVAFEVRVLDVYLGELRKDDWEGYTLKKSIIALIICIFFKQRATARFSNSSTAKKGVTELSVAWYAETGGTKDEQERCLCGKLNRDKGSLKTEERKEAFPQNRSHS